MCEKRANVETAAAGPSHEAGRQLFAVYGQNDPSPVLTWLPIFLGLLASALVALAFCPVPRSQTVSAARALFLAITDVLATVAALRAYLLHPALLLLGADGNCPSGGFGYFLPA